MYTSDVFHLAYSLDDSDQGGHHVRATSFMVYDMQQSIMIVDIQYQPRDAGVYYQLRYLILPYACVWSTHVSNSPFLIRRQAAAILLGLKNNILLFNEGEIILLFNIPSTHDWAADTTQNKEWYMCSTNSSSEFWFLLSVLPRWEIYYLSLPEGADRVWN